MCKGQLEDAIVGVYLKVVLYLFFARDPKENQGHLDSQATPVLRSV